MWLQTGNEKQWLKLEHDRIATQARPHRRAAAAAVTAITWLGRLLRAVVILGAAGTARVEYPATRDRLATH